MNEESEQHDQAIGWTPEQFTAAAQALEALVSACEEVIDPSTKCTAEVVARSYREQANGRQDEAAE